MAHSKDDKLSRRERQIMDIVFREGAVTVSDVLAHLPDPPSYSAVRATIGVLEDKGRLRHRKEGRRFIYSPTVTRNRARKSALEHLLKTFFDGSVEGAVATLLELQNSELGPEELTRLKAMIEEAQKEGR